ncbi:Aldo/keto reductase [Cadophora sp. DSE1049]|nr:Aldo/keto reductase [Cadophora sp. DSE1049]
MPPTLLDGSPIPKIIYGTARRVQDRLPDLSKALQTGYRAFDTACSRRFHNQQLDGKELFDFLTRHGDSLSRNKILVLKSVLQTATDLKVDTVDVYFLQTPLDSKKAMLVAWQALESIVDRGGIRYLGMANVKISRLRLIYEEARIKPAFVQNWFRRATGYDAENVAFCRDNDIVYEAFGIFDDDNSWLLENPSVRRIALHTKLFCNYFWRVLLQGG